MMMMTDIGDDGAWGDEDDGILSGGMRIRT